MKLAEKMYEIYEENIRLSNKKIIEKIEDKAKQGYCFVTFEYNELTKSDIDYLLDEGFGVYRKEDVNTFDSSYYFVRWDLL